MLVTDRLKEEYIVKEKTTTMIKANVFALLLVIPIVLVGGGIYYFYHPFNVKEILLSDSFFIKLILFVVLFILSIGIHEFIHGLFWSFFCVKHWKSISFGIDKSTGSPYCHCEELLKVWQYVAGALAPGVILGAVPYMLSVYWGNIMLLLLSLFSILGAGGDIMMVSFLIGENPNYLVLDHPKLVGCMVYCKNSGV
ncbi:Putative zincin peptidase [Anaeromicropila populeti]|uniref:Putative zincin peptidase n=2 Tax=Anaeromicropila populeti TaxID=37658 RepID=A0A1I6JQ22_9FIRM|nr:Putative zincin peptidase [Anaeromicropila populeti]